VTTRRLTPTDVDRLHLAHRLRVLLAAAGFQFNYWFVLPGLLLYGGVAVVLTVNDPISLSDVPPSTTGSAPTSSPPKALE
jgi:hypothetical protein